MRVTNSSLRSSPIELSLHSGNMFRVSNWADVGANCVEAEDGEKSANDRRSLRLTPKSQSAPGEHPALGQSRPSSLTNHYTGSAPGSRRPSLSGLHHRYRAALSPFGGADAGSGNRSAAVGRKTDPRSRGIGLPPAEKRRAVDPADQQEPIREMEYPQGQAQRTFSPSARLRQRRPSRKPVSRAMCRPSRSACFE